MRYISAFTLTLSIIAIVFSILSLGGCDWDNPFHDESGDPGERGACFLILDLDHIEGCEYRADISITCDEELSMIEYKWDTSDWSGDWKRFDMRNMDRATIFQEFPYPDRYYLHLIAYDESGGMLDRFDEQKDIPCE